MKLLPIIIFTLFLTNFSNAQQNFLDWVTYLNIVAEPAKSASVDSFVTANRNGNIPYIEGDKAVFLYRGSANTVAAAGDFNGWSPSYSLQKISTTNLYYYIKSFEPNARLDYKFVLNGSNWILDPLNSKTVSGGFGPNSELAMPQYIQPAEIVYNPSIPHGTILTTSLASTNGAGTFQTKIYLPPGYAENITERYPVVYFHDGYEYIDLASAVIVMDNLIAQNKIRPVIAVFVKPNNRNDEYAGNKRSSYAQFFATQVTAYADNNFRTITRADSRLTLGDSFGGNISGYISYHYPEVFGLCGLHSGAFWPNSYEVYNLFINAPRKDVSFAAVWGTYEGLWENMRSFRDQMTTKGYSVLWSELPEGHSWGLWRANIDFMLEHFFPPLPSSVTNEEYIPGKFTLRAYPNPFNPQTAIRFSLGKSGNVSLVVYDALGRIVTRLADAYYEAGSHQVSFNAGNLSAGIYYVSLIPEKGIMQSTKVVLVK